MSIHAIFFFFFLTRVKTIFLFFFGPRERENLFEDDKVSVIAESDRYNY